MIGFLRGKIIEMLPTRILLDVGGVGYEVLVPISFCDGLGSDKNKEVCLHTHLAVREDAHVLYGFKTREERDFFRTVIQSVSGIGPKMGLNILSAMPLPHFRSAVAAEDVKAISTIPGIGKKTAERLVVELRDKVGITGKESGAVKGGTSAQVELNPRDEAVRALVALQIKPVDAISMVEKAAAKIGGDPSTEELVKACLQKS